jgi:hypothetical protein
MKFARLCALLGLAMSCRSDSTGPLPAGATPFVPPASYLIWWREIEQCSGVSGGYSAVHWYVVADVPYFTVGSDMRVRGRWEPVGNSITIAGWLTSDSLVVRHEELHAVLQTGDHPTEYFDTKCGTIISH